MKNKTKQTIKPLKTQESVVVKKTGILAIFSFLLKVITFPFYCLYLWLFKVPPVPMPVLGFVRFLVFITLSLQNKAFELFLNDFCDKHKLPSSISIAILGILAIVMLIGLFFSFMETFGYHDATYSGVGFHDNKKKYNSKFEAFNETLEYRDSVLKTKYGTTQVDELKKTGFMTDVQLNSLSNSPEVNEALEFANTRMKSYDTGAKYNYLKSLFGH